MLLAAAKGGQMLVKPEDLASFAAMQGRHHAVGSLQVFSQSARQLVRQSPIDVGLTINDYLDGLQARSKTDEADAPVLLSLSGPSTTKLLTARL